MIVEPHKHVRRKLKQLLGGSSGLHKARKERKIATRQQGKRPKSRVGVALLLCSFVCCSLLGSPRS